MTEMWGEPIWKKIQSSNEFGLSGHKSHVVNTSVIVGSTFDSPEILIKI